MFYLCGLIESWVNKLKVLKPLFYQSLHVRLRHVWRVMTGARTS